MADHRSTSRISARLLIYVCCWLTFVPFNHAFSAAFGPHRDPGLTQPRIRTLIGGEYWGDQLTPDYVDYLAQVKPDIIHAGVLGPELASVLADPGKLHAVTPLNLTNIPNIKAYQAFCREYVPRIQSYGIKVQTTFSMIDVWGDHEKNSGWFKYYNDLWEKDLLGPKPSPDAKDLFERDAKGGFIRSGSPGWYMYAGCVNNPAWRAVLKQMLKAALAVGFDGFMAQFPHARGPCACEYCQVKFRAFMKARYGPNALRERFAITDIDHHVFEATGQRAGMPGPIDVDAREFGAICVQDCFEDVFENYGRSLKPGLIVSMWTHFREFLHPDVMSAEEMKNVEFSKWMDERALLPAERWGKGENYLWYSSPVYQSKLEKGLLGDNTLDYKYMRAMASDRPFHVVKYEYFRWRATVGEAMANGGIAFGVWRGGWSGGKDRETPHLKTYFQFIRDNTALLFPRQSAAEATVIYPRASAYSGDVRFFEPVRRLGAGLMAAHVLFDFTIDQKMTPETLARYKLVVLPATAYLGASQERMLDAYAAGGGRVVVLPTAQDTAAKPPPENDKRGRSILWADLTDRTAVGNALRKTCGTDLSNCDAPWTVQIQADRQPVSKRFLIHLVNYNRNEKEPGKELPIAAAPVAMDLHLPTNLKVKAMRFLTPEITGPQQIDYKQDGERLAFKTPGFLVYGMAVIQCD